jgi:hypothetical protein
MHCVKSAAIFVKSSKICRKAHWTCRPNGFCGAAIVAEYPRDGFFLSQNFIGPATKVSSKRRVLAKMHPYERAWTGEESGDRDMQLHDFRTKLSAIRSFAAPTQCPQCGDVMVAPVSSEFVEGGEIRHHWECESCGELSSTSIPLAPH